MASYQDFLDYLAQLQEDQSLFESELGTAELQGVQHEEIVKMGKQLLKKLRQFAKMGRSFAETLPPDFVSKLTDSIVCYRDLIMPPKVCGGYCPCLKPARSEIKCSGSEKALENARKKLQPCIVSIEKFISNFEEDFSEGSFKVDATRRLKSTQELLVSRQQASDGEGISTGMPISRRVLVKAQSTLQEIMNSAANISSAKAKEHLLELDKLSTDLKKARDQEINTFNHLEDGMHENNLMDMLHRLREDSEVLHSDANSKVRDSIKRWSTVKTLSVPRKVVEYQEETEYLKPGSISIGPPPIADIDPTKLIKKTGTKMNSMGQQLAFGVVNVVQVATSEVGSVAFQSAMGVKNIASIGANSAAKAAKSALGTDSDPPPSAPSPQVKHGKGATPQSKGNSKFNPLDSIKDGFDSITGNNHPPPPPPAKKSAGKFNPLDSIMDGIDSVTGANQPPKKNSSSSSLGLFNPLEGF
eukprot:gene30405-39647_t